MYANSDHTQVDGCVGPNPSEQLEKLQLLFASNPSQQQRGKNTHMSVPPRGQAGGIDNNDNINDVNNSRYLGPAAIETYIHGSGGERGGYEVNVFSTDGDRDRVRKQQKVSRILIYVDHPERNFHLDEADVANIFSVFGQVDYVRLLTTCASAEVCLNGTAAGACVHELDGVELPNGLGVLHAVLLSSSESAEEYIPASAIYTSKTKQEITKSPGMYSQDRRPAYQKSNKTPDISAEEPCTPPAWVSRLELVDLFTYEPEFCVADNIRGKDDGNVKYIMKQAKHKVDISINGKPLNDAPVAKRLHVTVSADDHEAYERAVLMLEDLLQSVCEEFVQFCETKKYPVPFTAGFKRHIYEQKNDGSLVYLGVKERSKVWLAKHGVPGSVGSGSGTMPVASGSIPVSSASLPVGSDICATSYARQAARYGYPPGITPPQPLHTLAVPGLPAAAFALPTLPHIPPGMANPHPSMHAPFFAPIPHYQNFHPGCVTPMQYPEERISKDRSRSRERDTKEQSQQRDS